MGSAFQRRTTVPRRTLAITTRADPPPSSDYIAVRIHTGQPDHRQNRWAGLRRCALCPIQYGKLTITSLDSISLLLFIFSYNLAHWVVVSETAPSCTT